MLQRKVTWLALALLASGSVCSPAPTTTNPQNAIIFVPGSGGSELEAKVAGSMTVTLPTGTRTFSYDAGELVWLDTAGIVLRMIADPDYFEILRFHTDAPCPTDDFDQNDKLVTLPGAYGDVVPFFSSRGYTLDQNLFLGTYDWRISVTCHNQRLDGLVKRAIAKGAQRVDIVAHSQGTQVVRSYLTSSPENLGKVGTVVLMAGPMLGTPSVSYQTAHGSCLWEKLWQCVGPPELMQRLLASYAGSLDSVAAARYSQPMDGRDESHPHPYVITNASGIRAAATAAELDAMWSNAGVPSAYVTSARDWHGDDAWLATLGPSQRIAIAAGTGRCTIGEVDRSPSGELSQRFGADGDDVVVRQSAALSDSGGTFDLTAGRKVYYRPASHGWFASKDGLALAFDLLSSTPSAPAGSVSSPPPSWLCGVLDWWLFY